MLKNKFLQKITLFAVSILLFATAAQAELLFALPKFEGTSASARFSNVAKTISDTFPVHLFAALEKLAPELGAEDAVKVGKIIFALKDSNMRELAIGLGFDGGVDVSRIGCVGTLANSEEFFKKAIAAGNFTLFDLVKAIGGQPLVDMMDGFGGEVYSLAKCTFQRGADGVFVHEDNYVMLEGNAVISFQAKEDTIAAAANFKSNSAGKAPNLKDENIFVVNVEKLSVEIGMSHTPSTMKFTGLSNVFTIYPAIAKMFDKKGMNVPVVGSGSPFCAFGGNSQIDGVGQIEDAIMMANDDELTGMWAGAVAAAQRFGLTKEDLGSLLSGSFGLVLGLSEKIFGLEVPVGGYISITGKDGAAAKLISAIHDASAESGAVLESKVEGWDKVYTMETGLDVPNVFAQRGESLLFGIISPENLTKTLSLDGFTVPLDKLAFWFNFNFERIWNAGKVLMTLKTVVENLFTKPTEDDKKFDALLTRFLSCEIPLKSFGLWMESPEKFGVDFLGNPASTPDFWLNLFEIYGTMK